MMDEKFYLRFESLHRGDTKTLLAKFRVYEPIISLICCEANNPKFLDIGCGNGEFLTFVSSIGGDVIGVEKNAAYLKGKNNKMLLEYSDALTWLKRQDDSSFDFISAIHVIEHLDFSYLYEMVGEIKRVLKESGIILLETPNPDNVTVATKNFYTDPTHLRLIPSSLLSFVVKDHGFSVTHKWGVNESPHIEKSTSIYDVIGGASPDYTIFGLVNENAFEGKLENLLRSPKGRSTKEMCDFFEARYQHDYSIISKELKKIDNNIFEQNRYYRDQMFEVSNEIIRLRHSFERELSSIYASKSWKVTAPLRFVANRLRVGKKIITNALVSLKNNSIRDFFAIYSEKCRRFVVGTLGDMDKRNWNHRGLKRGAFFDKYKRMLNKAIRKKK